jgi:hypothetical protein
MALAHRPVSIGEQDVSGTSTKLLQAAAEIVGSSDILATHLGIEHALLEAYMTDRRELPDRLLLKAVDIILADRQSGYASAGTPATEGLLQ